MVLAVSGNVKAPEVLARAEQLFGNGAGPGGGAEPDARTGALRRS
jgi:predicted Zn-dependent peptidase